MHTPVTDRCPQATPPPARADAPTPRERAAAFNDHIRFQVAELTDVRQVVTRKQLGEQLGCGRQSLGRKIRGGGFTAFEVAYLSERYGIHAGLGDPRLTFALPLDPSAAGAGDNYVASLAAIGRELDAAQPDRSLMRTRTVTGDVPAPSLFAEPTLALLVLYGLERGRGTTALRFALGELRRERGDYLGESRRRYEYYAALSCEEIWGRDPLHAVFERIARLARGRLIAEADLREVFAALRRWSGGLAQTLLTGRKERGGSLRLYQSRHYAPASLTTIRTDKTHHALIRLTDATYGVSRAAYTVDACDRFIDAAKSRSTLIGGDGSGEHDTWLAGLAREIDDREASARAALAA